MAKKILRNLPNILLIYFFGIISAFVLYLVANKILKQPNFISIIHLIWDYPIFTKDQNTISVGKMITGIGLIVLGFHFSKQVSRQLALRLFPKFKLEKGAIASFENLSFYFLLFFCTLIALDAASVPLTAFTVVGGALAIGFGFGSQNLMNNFISGIILQMERPIKFGDTIEIDGAKGVVNHIGARSTILHTSNGTTYIIPNSQILDKKVTNYTFSNNEVRSEVKIIVPIKQNLEDLKNKILANLASYEEILKSPIPQVMLIDFLDDGTGIVLNVFFWITLEEKTSKTEIESEVRYDVYKILYPDVKP
jgi:potassium efflux system protein